MNKNTISVFDVLKFGGLVCMEEIRQEELAEEEIDESKMFDESNYHGE